MKAVVCTKYGPPEVLQLRELKKPIPQKNEVLIKVYATTVSAADFRVRSFTVPKSVRFLVKLALGFKKPRKDILGMELSGVVEAIGANVTKFKRGDQIFAATLKNFGAYAEYNCLPQDGPMVLKPINLSFEEAAAIPIGARTALHFLKKANIKEGQKVLIYGASGSVGTYAVQLAKHFGAEVTGVCSDTNLNLVKSLGAQKVIDYTKKDFVQQLEEYDIILLAVDKLPFHICNQHLKKEGIYMNVTEPFPSWAMIWASITTKKKMVMSNNSPETAKALLYIKDLVEKGVLKPVMDRAYPLDQIVQAHAYVDKGHKKGNVVITVFP
ncbi:NAD(P)-dependent alcohol dehydrogenase [Spongiimicrobium sp. 3-5]|uniref:NAD(P)-dependent alcohol dehydrogenase n=1 Tax=Spongiimicrobium sp. 3-5 TaxID=3332596 RepID=UPI00397FE622